MVGVILAKRLTHLLIIFTCYFYILPTGLASLLLWMQAENVGHRERLYIVQNIRIAAILLLAGWLVWAAYGLATAIAPGGRRGIEAVRTFLNRSARI